MVVARPSDEISTDAPSRRLPVARFPIVPLTEPVAGAGDWATANEDSSKAAAPNAARSKGRGHEFIVGLFIYCQKRGAKQMG